MDSFDNLKHVMDKNLILNIRQQWTLSHHYERDERVELPVLNTLECRYIDVRASIK